MHGLIQTMKTSSVASEMIEQMLAEALGSALSETTGESVQVRRTAGQELPTGSPTWFLSGLAGSRERGYYWAARAKRGFPLGANLLPAPAQLKRMMKQLCQQPGK